MKDNSFLSCVIILLSSVLAAISQLLLKLSTRDKHKNEYSVYLNIKVLLAYAILSLTMLINVYAYRRLELKIGSILSASSYVFIMLLSVIFLKEVIGWRGIGGNLLIFIGIIMFFIGM